MRKTIISTLIYGALLAAGTSCSDYLDIIPEGVPSMENAFSNRTNTEKFLYTCYSYLPGFDNPGNSVGFLAGDEYWLIPKGTGQLDSRVSLNCWEIGRGSQNSNAPYMDYWEGGQGAGNIWIGIRDCNIFLENIYKPQDVQDYERERWIAEVKFLKAFYHFWMLQLYGPIPIMDKNIDVNAGIDEVRAFRDPVDDVVNYIVNTLDEVAEILPLQIENEGQELGRITRPIAKALKAKVLLFAASPLMNGNNDYANIKDARGINLFPTSYDQNKWKLAADAAKEAIEIATEGGHELYYFRDYVQISDATRTGLSIREAVCERWNKGIIWGSTRNVNGFQTLSFPKISSVNNNWNARSLMAPTLSVAEQFYSSNGVPIEEDNNTYWSENYATRYDVVTIPDEGDNKYLLQVGGNTAALHLNREPRFYANLGFDRGSWYIAGNTNDTTGVAKLNVKRGEYSGMIGSEDYSITGYFAKKVCSYKSTISNTSFSAHRYAFPIIRMADLHMMYAEALNESLESPTQEVYEQLDLVRARAGLKGVIESWSKYSKYPSKPTTKEGLREIIRRERLNELALEGQRFWDMRRWKIELPKVIKGWNVKGDTEETFYRVTTIFERAPYSYKEFLWPIKVNSIQKNPNLLQNPGW